jgi:hypothetical protein
MAYVRASGDLATVRDGYTRVVKALGHRSPSRRGSWLPALRASRVAPVEALREE